MIPHHAKDLPVSTKYIEIISITENRIVWAVPDVGTEIILNKEPIKLKFRINGDEQKVKKLIQDHFIEMNDTTIRKDACNKLSLAFYKTHEIDGNDKVTYNNMSLLHFLGTWLGPTSNPHAKGHAIMNNLHFELFGFHQYHGKQYEKNNKNEWKQTLNDCGNYCKHETCLKHAKNKEMNICYFYKNGLDIFSTYCNYLKYLKNQL